MIRRILAVWVLCVALVTPVVVQSAGHLADDGPLPKPLAEWLSVLAVTLFGGLASWFIKVKRGQVPALSVFHLVGELTVAAFAGLVAFLLCKSMGVNENLTPAISGIAGYMGAPAIEIIERALSKRAKQVLNVDSGPVPLGKE